MSFFTVIVPSYNRAHLIGETILSVVNQTFKDWELIIVDDGSTDNTKEVVEKFMLQNPRIKYQYQHNAERSAARNYGIRKATGEFICLLDSDDRWLSNHLELIKNTININNNRKAIYFTGLRWCFENGETQDVIFEELGNISPVEYVIKNQIAPSTQCFQRELLEKNQFNIKIKVNEDVELNARLANDYPLIRIPIVTVEMLVHEHNTKSLFIEYITPQVVAMKMIFSNPNLKGKISKSFQKKIQHSFDHQYILIWDRLNIKRKLYKSILTYLFKYPLDNKNKSLMVLLLYNLPLGKTIKKTVSFIKKFKN